jgi:hypothetical protein
MYFIDFICYLNDKISNVVKELQTIRSFDIN